MKELHKLIINDLINVFALSFFFLLSHSISRIGSKCTGAFLSRKICLVSDKPFQLSKVKVSERKHRFACFVGINHQGWNCAARFVDYNARFLSFHVILFRHMTGWQLSLLTLLSRLCIRPPQHEPKATVQILKPKRLLLTGVSFARKYGNLFPIVQHMPRREFGRWSRIAREKRKWRRWVMKWN